MVTTLIAFKDPDARSIFEAERDPGGDGPKYAYVAEAAPPRRAREAEAFRRIPTQSLARRRLDRAESAVFQLLESVDLQPYLKPALEALPQIKRSRKIFFLVDWLNAFIGGQQSAAAQAQVHEYLRTAALEPDLRLKILQAVDELDRTVKIRRKFPE